MKIDSGPRVLVVDDEPSIVDAVATSLRYEGFTVDEAMTGRKALAQAQEDPPDLVILDVMLPDLDGLEVTRRLRADGVRVPVLFLTARDTLQDKLAGLTVGGDDYVTKPFALAEVIARVHAILRRTGYEPEDDGVLRFSDVELDESAHEVRRGGHVINLTATEFNLLRYFMLNPRHVLSKSQILDHVWHYDFGGDGNVVETYVSYLRKKLEKFGPRSSTPSASSATPCVSPSRPPGAERPAEQPECRCGFGSSSRSGSSPSWPSSWRTSPRIRRCAPPCTNRSTSSCPHDPSPCGPP